MKTIFSRRLLSTVLGANACGDVSTIRNNRWSRQLRRNASATFTSAVRSEPSGNRHSPRNASSFALEQALQRANHIIADCSSSSSSSVNHNASSNHSATLQNLINQEVSVVTQILRKLVGANHSLNEVEKYYQNDARENDPLLRGMSCLLISKAAEQEAESEETRDQAAKRAEIAQGQMIVAKVVEMIHIAMQIHNKIRNVDSDAIAQTVAGSQQHLSNKVSVLYGDFCWAKAWKDLSDMHKIEVTDMMTTVLVNCSLGQFFVEEETKELAAKLNLEYWLEKNFLLSACLPAFGCKSVLTLAKADESLQNGAYQFGQNLGYFMKAYREIQWFLDGADFEPTESVEFCSLPAVMHAIETGDTLENILCAKNEETNIFESKFSTFNYDREHMRKIVNSGPGIAKSKIVLEMFRSNAYANLNQFPRSDARDCLRSILGAMNAD